MRMILVISLVALGVIGTAFLLYVLFVKSVKIEDNSNMAVDTNSDYFLSGFDFNSGDYFLVITEAEKSFYVPQSVLKANQNAVTVSGFNWKAFIPGEGFRGPLLQLYKDGLVIKTASGATAKVVTYQSLIPQAIELEYVSYSGFRVDIEALLPALKKRVGIDILALSIPEFLVDAQYKYTEVITLPTFWLKASENEEIVFSDIKRELKEYASESDCLITTDFEKPELQNGQSEQLQKEIIFFNTTIRVVCATEYLCEKFGKHLLAVKAIDTARQQSIIESLPDAYFEINGEDRVLSLDVYTDTIARSPFGIEEITYSISYYQTKNKQLFIQ